MPAITITAATRTSVSSRASARTPTGSRSPGRAYSRLGAGAWNERGFDFYDRLVDGLLERGIAPYLTLYHWDLPQALQEAGGWANRETAARFAEYAVEVARRLGDRAAAIATHNEPWVVAILGHEAGTFAPGLKSQKLAMQVSHHLLLSHGMALQAMRAERCAAPLGIVLNQAPVHAAIEFAGGSRPGAPRRRLDDPLVHGRAAARALSAGRARVPGRGRAAGRGRRPGRHPAAAGFPRHQLLHAQSLRHRELRWLPSTTAAKSPTWAGRCSRAD